MGGVDRHSTWKLSFLRWGGEGRGGGGEVNRHSTWEGSTTTLEGLPLTMLISGGQSTLHLGRICNNFRRITSANVGPGGSIDTQLGKDLQQLWKDRLWQCWSWGVDWHYTWKGFYNNFGRIASDNVDPGGQSTLHLGRICNNFGRIASDNVDPRGVNQHYTWKGSTTTLEGLPLTMLILGRLIDTPLGKDPQQLWKDCLWQCWSWGVNQHSTWKGSATTLEGMPLTMLILGGQSTLNLERICNNFGRIASDNVDPGGWGLIDTQLGKDLQHFWKDHLWQCWSWGLIDTPLGKDPQQLWKDCIWQCWSWGVNWHSTWEGSATTLEGSPLTMLILGWGVDCHSTWKGSTTTLEGSPLTMLILGGVNWHSTWEGSATTLEGLPLTMFILGGGVDWHYTWKGSTTTLEGLPLTMLILGGSIDTTLGKDPQQLWKDHLWQCWSWGLINTPLGKDLQQLWKDQFWQCWSWGVGGSIDTPLGKDPQQPSWVSIDPPKIKIVRGNPSKVVADPFQVECQSTLPISTLSEVILPKLLQILFQVECRLTPPLLIRGWSTACLFRRCFLAGGKVLVDLDLHI